MEFNEKAFHTCLCTLYSGSIGIGPYDYHIKFGEGLTSVEGHNKCHHRRSSSLAERRRAVLAELDLDRRVERRADGDRVRRGRA